MKGLFIADFDFEDNKNRGITNKVIGMYNSFINNNIEMDLFYQKNIYFRLKKMNEDIEIINCSRYDKYKFLLENILQNEYNFIFIRYILSNYFFIEFLMKVKEINPDIKIILEFPTLPYDKEIKNQRILSEDKYFREFLKESADYAVVYNNIKEAFGIGALFIGNGIEITGKSILNYKKINTSKIVIIGVGNISIWHGYDRVILGIHKYLKDNNQSNLEFQIIGEGKEISNLIKLVHELKLEKNVKFLGHKSGIELQELYQNADIAIGTLSRSRINMKDGSALKNREYCVIGLPFIYSGIDVDFDLKFKYALNIEDSEEPVDINAAIEFIKDIKNDPSYINNMRIYAEKHLDWNVKIKRILNKIEM
ncbi:glycosyltransferase [Clostridium sp. YIM B02555]|uniref:glycosyltransferase n=1 Tax=Clostridium sp. YIM B02555 TaxID=2911968 RepID=UPI001EED8EC2|nr:glycosyltransferase [Clostridium sp. YIM B02555]